MLWAPVAPVVPSEGGLTLVVGFIGSTAVVKERGTLMAATCGGLREEWEIGGIIRGLLGAGGKFATALGPFWSLLYPHVVSPSDD